MKLVIVHRVLKFKQSDWLKKYIDFNTGKRKNAFLKLMDKSTFGKRMENLRKTINVRLANNAEDYKKCVIKRSFVSQKTFNKKFVAILEIKPVLTLDKSIYVGFSIFDFSKLLVYEFYYTYIERKDNPKLLLSL